MPNHLTFKHHLFVSKSKKQALDTQLRQSGGARSVFEYSFLGKKSDITAIAVDLPQALDILHTADLENPEERAAFLEGLRQIDSANQKVALAIRRMLATAALPADQDRSRLKKQLSALQLSLSEEQMEALTPFMEKAHQFFRKGVEGVAACLEACPGIAKEFTPESLRWYAERSPKALVAILQNPEDASRLKKVSDYVGSPATVCELIRRHFVNLALTQDQIQQLLSLPSKTLKAIYADHPGSFIDLLKRCDQEKERLDYLKKNVSWTSGEDNFDAFRDLDLPVDEVKKIFSEEEHWRAMSDYLNHAVPGPVGTDNSLFYVTAENVLKISKQYPDIFLGELRLNSDQVWRVLSRVRHNFPPAEAQNYRELCATFATTTFYKRSIAAALSGAYGRKAQSCANFLLTDCSLFAEQYKAICQLEAEHRARSSWWTRLFGSTPGPQELALKAFKEIYQKSQSSSDFSMSDCASTVVQLVLSSAVLRAKAEEMIVNDDKRTRFSWSSGGGSPSHEEQASRRESFQSFCDRVSFPKRPAVFAEAEASVEPLSESSSGGGFFNNRKRQHESDLSPLGEGAELPERHSSVQCMK